MNLEEYLEKLKLIEPLNEFEWTTMVHLYGFLDPYDRRDSTYDWHTTLNSIAEYCFTPSVDPHMGTDRENFLNLDPKVLKVKVFRLLRRLEASKLIKQTPASVYYSDRPKLPPGVGKNMKIVALTPLGHAFLLFDSTRFDKDMNWIWRKMVFLIRSQLVFRHRSLDIGAPPKVTKAFLEYCRVESTLDRLIAYASQRALHCQKLISVNKRTATKFQNEIMSWRDVRVGGIFDHASRYASHGAAQELKSRLSDDLAALVDSFPENFNLVDRFNFLYTFLSEVHEDFELTQSFCAEAQLIAWEQVKGFFVRIQKHFLAERPRMFRIDDETHAYGLKNNAESIKKAKKRAVRKR